MVDAGNRMSTALDVGALVGQVSFEESVNNTTDRADFYRVTLDRSGRINAVLSGTGGAVDLQIIRDANSNGVVESGEVLEMDTNYGGRDGSVQTDVPAGTYFIGVGATSFTETNVHTLTITSNIVGTLTVDPGNQMSQALDLGFLNGRRTFADYAGDAGLDRVDYYRFTLDRPTDVSLTLAGTSENTSMRLIEDLNNNDVVESNEVIARTDSGFSSRSTPTSLNETLQPGTYFVDIGFFNNSGFNGSNYTLNFFTPGATPFPFGADGPFFNLSTDPDTIVLDGAQVGNLVVRALDGDDVVQGSASNDIIVGNLGNDRLLGNLGDDFLLGGRDNDVIERQFWLSNRR
ncbi:MAG TPA: hypothetical protein IGS31_15180 [Oscillatoriales cyanobacterium M4454_W2019_049]|nr:hypothetical protein [Oscillatoriales cyanobacterium M4454_W2019_049]